MNLHVHFQRALRYSNSVGRMNAKLSCGGDGDAVTNGRDRMAVLIGPLYRALYGVRVWFNEAIMVEVALRVGIKHTLGFV